MKLQAVAPESFVTEGIESERLPPLSHQLMRIRFNNLVKVVIAPAGIPVLANDRERKSTESHNRNNQEQLRHPSHILHMFPPENTELQTGISLRFGSEKD
jgi:hypothetical protein